MKSLRTLLALGVASLMLAGCSSVGRYAADRGRDLTDVFDLRYGNCSALALGVQVDVTMFLGTGIGYSDGTWTRAWYGRHAVDTDLAQFFGWIVISELNAATVMDNSADGWNQAVLVNWAIIGEADWTGGERWWTGRSRTIPGFDTFRVGAVLFLPFVHGGLHLNLGELVDFFGGIATFDLANDDGVPKSPPPPVPQPPRAKPVPDGMPPRPVPR